MEKFDLSRFEFSIPFHVSGRHWRLALFLDESTDKMSSALLNLEGDAVKVNGSLAVLSASGKRLARSVEVKQEYLNPAWGEHKGN